jgi:ADP-dependent NAD(P)H-hydrate dehydratase / NAD(P)H-hydrate epimerase
LRALQFRSDLGVEHFSQRFLSQKRIQRIHMKISSVKEMRNLDNTAIEKYGIADELLMENAGLAVYQVLSEKIGIRKKRFVIFSGAGNNGGDGFVVARKIHSNGGIAKVFLLGNPDRYQGAAKLNYDILANLPITIETIETKNLPRSEIFHCDAIIDAIFGTGLTREVEGKYADIIGLINQSKKPVISVDIPSGVSGDTGKIMGISVKADYTVTFGLPKIGNMLYPGFERCGRLYVTHISFPPSMYDDIKIEVNEPIAIPERKISGHKGDFGEALFIAGAAGYYGAPYFSAISFLKAGGGYSRLASPKSIIPFIANKGREIVFIPQKETADGSISLENKASLLELISKMDFVVIGPGLSLAEETQQLARELVQKIEKPILLDGDGITALAGHSEIIKSRKAPTILTPHLGEMSRIAKLSVDQIDENKVEIVRLTSRQLNAIIVLKGAHSLIGYPNGTVCINMSGNSGMATAGSGDVLTGTIAAMHGLGLSVEDAVRQGVFLHGFAGDLAAQEMGMDGMTAQDILELLPTAMQIGRLGLNEEQKAIYSGVTVI